MPARILVLFSGAELTGPATREGSLEQSTSPRAHRTSYKQPGKSSKFIRIFFIITMARSKTDAKTAHAARMRKIAHKNAIRNMYKKVEYNINNQMETIEDLQFLQNSFTAKSKIFSKKHNFNLRKHLATSISAYKMHENIEERLRQEHHFIRPQK